MSRALSNPRQERARAARALNRVLRDGKTSDQSIGTEDLTPLINELLLGSLRYWFSLNERVSRHLAKPLRDKDQDIYALLIVGAYQLLHMRVPDHAAINETVGAVGQLKKPWAKGLVNAVLRSISRDQDESPNTERSIELPDWIIERLQRDFPESAQALGQATTERAPMSLRVNVARTTPASYQQTLGAERIAWQPGYFPEHLILETAVAVRELPGHDQGLVSVQDAGAQFAAHLAADAAKPPERILDACAAPGGKLFHLAERFPAAALVALELSAERLAHLEQEASRLGHNNVRLIRGDATDQDWWQDAGCAADGQGFDLILLDAPCTGSGTLRRHPDIKVLRQPEDVAAAAQLQLAMLRNLWPLLRPGGRLIYCTCSLFAEENDQVIEAFLTNPGTIGNSDGATNSAAADNAADDPALPALEKIDLPTGTATRYGWQLLPLPAQPDAPNMTVDGFYFSCMTRHETRQEKAR